MRFFNRFFLFLIGILFTIILAGCQDEDFGYTAQEIRTAAFRKNFEKEFGKIDADQNWDLSRAMPRTAKYEPWGHSEATRAIPDATLQPNAEDIIKEKGNVWYEVDPATLQWLNENLVEEKNNTRMGEAFSLLPPASNDFAIFPIYQGKAGMDWDLHIVIGNKDYKIWSESEGLEKKSNANSSSWEKLGITYDDSYTVGAYAVRGQRILFNKDKVNEPFFFYLDITKGQTTSGGGNGDYAETGTAQRSDEGMMLALGCPIPSNIGTSNVNGADIKNHVMIIGCEDSNLADSDWDMNDVVFMIVGYPYVPDIVEYTRKRYLIEDLGNTYDFDFNDIVVDVDQEAVKKATLADDETSIVFIEDNSKRKQWATVKHLCGTLPFQVNVGDYAFPTVTKPTDQTLTRSQLGESATRADNESSSEVSSGVTGWEPDIIKEITGWNSAENNVKILVSSTDWSTEETVLTKPFPEYAEDNDGRAYSIEFPGTGKTPLIIATDQTVQWMEESVHIPESWWKTNLLFGYNLNLSCSPEDAGSVQGTGNYDQNAKISIYAKAASGYVFEKWDDEVTDNPRSITMDANKSLTAIFRMAAKVNVLWSVAEGFTEAAHITAMVNGAVVTSGEEFLENTSIRFFAEPTDLAKEFVNWTIGETVVSETPDFFYRVVARDNDKVSLVANFQNAWYDVEVPVDEDGGNIIWSGTKSLHYMQLQEDIKGKDKENFKYLYKSLIQGMRYLKLEFDGSYNGNIVLRDGDYNEITSANVSGKNYCLFVLTEEQVSKIFEISGLQVTTSNNSDVNLTKIKLYTESPISMYTITVTAGEHGSVTGGGLYETDAQITLTATPDSGYRVKCWKKDGVEIEGETQRTFKVRVQANAEYSVEFEEGEATAEVIWEGSYSGDGNGTRFQPNFTNLKAGTMTINFNALTASTTLDFITSWSNSLDPSQQLPVGTTSCQIDITETEVSMINAQGGMIIVINNSGAGITITSITIE